MRIGYYNDGMSAAVDHADDSVVAEALVEFLNAHEGVVAGRPIELVTCETRSDMALATDCGNQFVEEGVVAVATATSGFSEQVRVPVAAAGIPCIITAYAVPDGLADGELTSVLVNGSAQTHGFPMAVAVREGLTSGVTLVIDVPAAVEPMIFEEAAAAGSGIDYEYGAVPPGTADMLPQITAALQNKPGVRPHHR